MTFVWVLAALLALAVAIGVGAWLLRIERRPLEAWRVRRGKGLGVDELARRLGLDASALRAFAPQYRATTIPKRSGGLRRLLVPDAKTKALQRRLLRRLLALLRAHPRARGFERGKSIVHNARPHVGQAVVVRLDIVDFFPSTPADRIDRYFRRVGWDAEAAALLTRLTTHEDGLPQGAPTSPRLANLVNWHLDVVLDGFARRRKGRYTRYADDLTFSFPGDYPRRVRGVIQKTRRILKAKGYRLHRRKKFHIRRRHQRQEVTGLVVNAKVALPRRTRRWLRAVRHRAARGGPATLTPEQLAGWDALERMIQTQRQS